MATDAEGQEPDEDDIDVFEEDGGSTDGSARPEGVTTRASEWISLPGNDLLSIPEVDRLLRQKPARIIAVVGEYRSGKTTLVSALYERFLEGGFDRFKFSFSRSLAGFDNRSFSSRAASGRPIPDTPRTSVQDGVRFFHLRVADQNADGFQTDLMLSERAGETYRDARDKPELAHDLIEVAKATDVVFVVDGAKVFDPLMRAEAFAAVRGMIRVYSDEGVIGANTSVHVVTTKMDVFKGNDKAEALEQLRLFEEKLDKSFRQRFRALKFLPIAARDPDGHTDVAHGMERLLADWVQPVVVEQGPPPPLPELKSQFDLLLARCPPGGAGTT